MSLPEALRLLRLELGLSQADLAQKLGKGFVTVNRWENGRAFPTRANALDILALAKAAPASPDCVAYLQSMLMPDYKRSCSGAAYGFPDVDRDFLFQLADGSANGLYVVDAQTYTLLYANRTAESFACRDLNEAGYPVSERRLTGQSNKRCYHFFGNRSAPCSFCPLRQADALLSQSVAITVPESGRRYIVRAKRTELKGRPVFVIYLTDTTEVENERHALYELTDDIPLAVGIYRLPLSGGLECLYRNKALRALLPQPEEGPSLPGPAAWALVHPKDRAALLAELKSIAVDRQNVSLPARIKLGDGRYRSFTVSTRLVKWDTGHFILYLMFARAE